MNYFFYGILFITSGGILSLFFYEKFKATITSLFTGIGTILVSIPAISIISGEKILTSKINFNEPIGTVTFLIDPLSAFFILLVSVMSFLGTIYAIKYIKPYINKTAMMNSHFFFLGILISSMLLVVTVQHALVFIIVWEIMSLSSFFTVIFENNSKETTNAGINYLMLMHISVLFITFSFITLITKTGSMNFEVFRTYFQENPSLKNLIFILFFAGFGIKAGFVPFHMWLPKAHPAAPSHISGIMSGVMIKTGIYGILRVLTITKVPSVGIAYFVLLISISTSLYGILYAITQKHLKKMLAYSSIENIGIIGIGLSIGMLGLAYNNSSVTIMGFAGCLLHILNHSIFKELLFFSTGSIYYKTHTGNMEKLGGLNKVMPLNSILFLIGAIAITGLPPLNGFIGEFIIYSGIISFFNTNNLLLMIVLILSIATLALTGALALHCFSKAYSITFLGQSRSSNNEEEKQKKIPLFMNLPLIILALFSITIGLFPQYAFSFIKNTTLFISNSCVTTTEVLNLIEILKTISKCLWAFVGLTVCIYAVRKILIKNKLYKHTTWGCGYALSNNKMQYTSSSYSGQLLSALSPLFVKKFTIKFPSGLFPVKAGFDLHIYDILEIYFLNFIVNLNWKFLSMFRWIQNGSTQRYILYGLLFLIISFFIAVRI